MGHPFSRSARETRASIILLSGLISLAAACGDSDAESPPVVVAEGQGGAGGTASGAAGDGASGVAGAAVQAGGNAGAAGVAGSKGGTAGLGGGGPGGAGMGGVAAGGAAAGGGGKAGGGGLSDPCEGLDCDDGIDCTADSCEGGMCLHAPGAGGGAAACPEGESCVPGKGCSAPSCTSDAQCAEYLGGDPCKVARCDAATSTCTFPAPDMDGDGHPPPACGGDDCDDGDPARHPGAAEACDGKDNGCDGSVDQGDLCGPLDSCQAGACTCRPEFQCGASCVDTSADPGHCGACGHDCGAELAGAACIGGLCACAEGTTPCSGACVDLAADGANCGACGHECGAACEGGVCLPAVYPVLAAPEYFTDLLPGGDLVYALTFVEEGAVGKGDTLAIHPGDSGFWIKEKYADAGSTPHSLASDGKTLFWAVQGAGLKGAIMALGLKPPLFTFQVADGQLAPGNVAANGVHVYWTSLGPNFLQAVRRIPKEGGTQEELAAGFDACTGVLAEAEDVYWVCRPPGEAAGTLSRWHAADGSVSVLAAALGDADGMAADAEFVFVNTQAAIVRVPKAGGPPQTLASPGSEGFARGLVLEGQDLYWPAAGQGVMRMGKAGGAAAPVAKGDPQRIAVDGAYVYWSENGALFRWAK